MAERRRGFTLAELMTALVVIGILAALAVPLLDGVRARAHTGAALSQFAADVSYARMLAVRGQARVEVEFLGSGACGPRRFGRFTAEAYRVTLRDSVPQVVKEVRLSDVGSGVCLDSNNDRTMVFNSRGILVPFENRTVWSRRGTVADSLKVSVLGRVRRL